MSKSLSDIYDHHHRIGQRSGFSILEHERGDLFSRAIGRNKKILDIGCRDGTLTKYFVKDNAVTGADIDATSLAKAKTTLGIETIEMDLNGDWKELSGKSYDVVVAGEVLEHLYFPSEVIRKIKLHLNPGGLFVGSVPNAFSLKNRLRLLLGRKKHTPLGDPTHINHFKADELKNILLQHFNKVQILGLGQWRALSRLSPSMFAFDLVFICELESSTK